MYRYTQFGTTDLPAYEPEYDVGPLKSQDLRVRTAAGIYDAGGSEQLRPGETVLTHRGTLLSDDDADFETDTRALLQLRGTYAKLYREWRDGGTEWVNARCLDVRGTRRRGMHLHQQFEFVFLVLSPAWNGSAVNDTETLTGSPHAYSVTNGGDAPVRDAILTVTAGSSAITSITLATGDCEIEFTATIASGEDLVIDCGAMSVLNDGVGAYADFARTSSHTSDFWFVLAPGSNPITVTYSGGGTGSSVAIAFYEAWE